MNFHSIQLLTDNRALICRMFWAFVSPSFPQFYTEPWAMCTYFDLSWCEVNICDMCGLFWLSQGRRADCDQGQTCVHKNHTILKMLEQGVISSYLKRKSTALPKTYNLLFSTCSIFNFCFWSVQILIRHHVSSFSDFPEQLSKVFFALLFFGIRWSFLTCINRFPQLTSTHYQEMLVPHGFLQKLVSRPETETGLAFPKKQRSAQSSSVVRRHY